MERKLWRGLWLPAHERHLMGWMDKVNHVVDGKPTYQFHKLEAALSYVKNFRVAVDIGGHCGLWSMHISKRFEFVHAFEPVALHQECFKLNAPAQNVMLYPVALGEREGSIAIHTSDGSSGDSWVDGEGAIPMKTLDSFTLPNVDFMKLDCEGYELFALRGAAETIALCHPVIVVEQKPGRAQKWGLGEIDAVTYLESMGAKVLKVMSGDYIMGWPE